MRCKRLDHARDRDGEAGMKARGDHAPERRARDHRAAPATTARVQLQAIRLRCDDGERIGRCSCHRRRPCASSIIAAWPSYCTRSRQRPMAAATASNSRPQELASGALTPRSIIDVDRRHRLAGQKACETRCCRRTRCETRPADAGDDMRIGVAPGLADGLRAARHRDRLEAAPSRAKLPIVAEQEFAAPERAVVAPAEAVEHDAEHRFGIQRHTVFRHAGGEMGVMMLHLDNGDRCRSASSCRAWWTDSPDADRPRSPAAHARTARDMRRSSAR